MSSTPTLTANSTFPGCLGIELLPCTRARTPGAWGFFDQGDPTVTTLLGDTPGSLGFNDWGDPTLPAYGLGGSSFAGMCTRTASGVALSTGTAVPATTQVVDAEIEALDLAPTARAAAYALKTAHPSVSFTSGRRAKGDQARAMADVVSNRQWITETYAASDLRTARQKWLDDNPKVTSKTKLAAGLLSVFDAATPEAVGKFRKQLSAEAFDVQPVTNDVKTADAIKKNIRGQDGLGKFLESEGGLVRWHAQF